MFFLIALFANPPLVSMVAEKPYGFLDTRIDQRLSSAWLKILRLNAGHPERTL